MDKEIWKDIPGLEGRYQASNLGRIKSLPREITQIVRGKPRRGYVVGRIMKQQVCPNGYSRVRIDKILRTVHRLVLLTFDQRDDQQNLDVNHINSNRSDNRLINLEWCSRSENIRHSLKYNNTLSVAKLTPQNVFKIRSLLKEKYTHSQLSKMFKVSRSTIQRIELGLTWKWLT